MLMTSAPDDDGRRGSGRTTRQMQAAPIGSLFVWCTPRLDYPRHLARQLGRDDLRIVSPSVLDFGAERLRGWRGAPAIVLDHAFTDAPEDRRARLAAAYELAAQWYGSPIPGRPT